MKRLLELYLISCDKKGCSLSIEINSNQSLPRGWVKVSIRHCDDCYEDRDEYFCPIHSEGKKDD